MILEQLVDAVVDIVKNYLDHHLPSVTVYATWVAAEANDASLSSVTINGQTVRGVPKHSHVTGLVAGDTVECLHPDSNKPLTIIGKVVGNISAV